MGITLLEKLDSACKDYSLQDSVCQQVQRIFSSRIYGLQDFSSDNYISGFGIPEILRYYSDNSRALTTGFDLIRKQILALEPRLDDVQLKSLHTSNEEAFCRLLMKIGDETVVEQFFF